MVEYSTWVSIVRTEATAQGADLHDFEKNSELIKVAAAVWNDRKQELQNASGPKAKRIAKAEVSVA